MLTPTLLEVATILGLPLGGKEVNSTTNAKFAELDYAFGKNGGAYSTFLEVNSKANMRLSSYTFWVNTFMAPAP